MISNPWAFRMQPANADEKERKKQKHFVKQNKIKTENSTNGKRKKSRMMIFSEQYNHTYYRIILCFFVFLFYCYCFVNDVLFFSLFSSRSLFLHTHYVVNINLKTEFWYKKGKLWQKGILYQIFL